MKFLIVVLICLHFTLGDLDTEWWKHTTMYELLVQSFKDSDGDGIGDIRGIISKLDHFVDLKIETLYLTPFYESPMKDMGYEISDYQKIHYKYGTMEDFEELMKEMKARGMKLMMDLVINHSGDSHEWFQKSIDRIDPYTDYYIWVNASGFDVSSNLSEPMPPNSWLSLFGGEAWEWNEKRQQFYYHRFLKEQPDLNLRNELVKTELKNMMKFWFDKGVAGFRLDAPMFYIESTDLSDRKGFHMHKENLKFIHEMRVFLDEYNKNHGGIERIYAAEARVSKEEFDDYYGTKRQPGAHFPFMYMDTVCGDTSATILYDQFYKWFEANPITEKIPVWVTEGHDGPRIGNRMSPEYADIFLMITMALPGSVSLYYGQEIGMKNGYITPEQLRDISGGGSRDPNRLVMQWDDSLNAGFSTNTTIYLPASAEYFERNVELQKKQNISSYNLVKTMSQLRKTETLKYGEVKFALRPRQILVFWRTYEDHETYVVVTNTDHLHAHVNLKYLLWDTPDKLTVAAASVNSEYKKGDKIRNNFIYQIPLRPLSCIVLSYKPNRFI